MMISYVFAIHNASSKKFLEHNLKLLNLEEAAELIVVSDSHKTFSTVSDAKFYHSKNKSRGAMLDMGFKKSTGELIVFVHPRSYLNKATHNYLLKNIERLNYGGFKHKFDSNDAKIHWLLKFTSWYSNYVRAKRGIYYLDHCIFVKRKLLDLVGGVPHLDIFEDTELCRRLKKHATHKLINLEVETSALRFEKNGIYKQSLTNQLLKLMFIFKLSPQKLNSIYEKKTKLNQ